MHLGIFAKTFVRSSLGQTLDAVKANGLECIQFNFACAGLPTLPESIPDSLSQQIQGALRQRSLFAAAISGTCNLIHPEVAQRIQDLCKLETLIRASRSVDIKVVTLCTGTRDPFDMWRGHPGNHLPEARKDLTASLDRLLPVAEQNGIVLGVEPEPANVIDSAKSARQLLTEMKSQSLKIVFDAANLIQPHGLDRQTDILNEAVELLGADIVLAHAKDLSGGRAEKVVPAGTGGLDYHGYLSLLQKSGFTGSIILHSLEESQVPASVEFLRKRLEQLDIRRAP